MIEWFLGGKFPASEQTKETEMLSPLCALLLLKPMDIRSSRVLVTIPSLGPRRLRKSNKVSTYL
ncbi:hypothetical protein RHMOL_Rhmol06G0085000 [Rhododendron molle]|uniref:Uncharacterized protein n=1 Tax=Rhododendron molle TaxID=49168 RepID=A0ACC0NC26_RHOML|nr:hypothetical protein RHMOL_Rhmol06G0085000 [Rhododendron molle]